MKIGLLLLCLCLAAVSSHPRRFLDCSDFLCTDPVSPVCGTDGKTYSNQCEMDMENKKRLCWIGHYNIVTKVKDGPCNPTTTVTIV